VGAYLVVSAFTQATRSDQALASTPGDIHIAWGPSALNLLFFGTLVLAVAMVAVYEVLWTAWRGATFGKNRTQLQVVDATNFEPAVPVRLLLRTMLWATPFTFAMLTWFYSVLFAWGALALLAGMYCWRLREDSGGRPLWDVLAGTHVITTDFDRPDRP
jgi:hypothetical protein